MNQTAQRMYPGRPTAAGRDRQGIGLRRTVTCLLAALMATSTEAMPDDKPVQPTVQPGRGSAQVMAPPGLYPYYLVPIFPFLWPAPPAVLSQPQPYTLVIWLPSQPPLPAAPATAWPVAPPQPPAEVPEPGPQSAPSMAAQAPSTVSTSAPAAPPEAVPPPAVAVAPTPGATPSTHDVAAPPETPRVVAPARKPPAAKPAVTPQPAAAAKPTKRKLCWREGRLDVCK